jgi:hypothetical protein
MSGTGLAKAGLIALMALGSVLLWIAIPAGWLWLGSQMQSSTQRTGFTPYLVVIVGIGVSMAVVGKLLAKLNRVYGRVSGIESTVRVRLPWHRSLRGEEDARQPRTVLDVVMVTSVTIALIVFAIWFFFLAGSSLPGAA